MIESLPRREREVFETLCRLKTGTTSAVRGADGRVAQRAAQSAPDSARGAGLEAAQSLEDLSFAAGQGLDHDASGKVHATFVAPHL